MKSMSEKIMSQKEKGELQKHLQSHKDLIAHTRSQLKIIVDKVIFFQNTEFICSDILTSIFQLDNSNDYLDYAIDKIQKLKP